MKTTEVLRIVKERGLELRLKDGRPLLYRPQGNEGVTDALLKVLARHRELIISILKGTT